ncbi:MAG: trigger factor [Planctomycetota bacterium]
MAEATATDTRIKTSVSDAGPCLKKISVEIPAEVVDERLESSIDSVSNEAVLPGFRKGRAPKRLLRKRFGDAISREAKGQLLTEGYQAAVAEHELKVVGEPTGEQLEEIEIAEGKGVSFELEVEVTPDFETPSFDGLDVFKPLIEIGDDRVEKQIEQLGVNEGDLEERDTPEPGDYLTGTGIMVDGEGTEHYNINGAVVRIPPKEDEGKGMALGVKVDDFANQLGSPKAGDTATIKVKGPDNHEVEALRGKDLTITFKVDRIDRIIPLSAGTLADRLGLDGEDKLKELVKVQLENRAAVEQQAVMRQQVVKHLREAVEFELPQRLTAAQAARGLQRRRMELLYRGVDQAEIESHLAELRGASDEAAARDLKTFFIVNRIADELEVQVDDAEMNGQIHRMAMQQRVRPEQLRQQLISNNQLGAVYTQIREHKTLDAIIEKAKVEDLSVEDFNKKFGKDADVEAAE